MSWTGIEPIGQRVVPRKHGPYSRHSLPTSLVPGVTTCRSFRLVVCFFNFLSTGRWYCITNSWFREVTCLGSAGPSCLGWPFLFSILFGNNAAHIHSMSLRIDFPTLKLAFSLGNLGASALKLSVGDRSSLQRNLHLHLFVLNFLRAILLDGWNLRLLSGLRQQPFALGWWWYFLIFFRDHVDQIIWFDLSLRWSVSIC